MSDVQDDAGSVRSDGGRTRVIPIGHVLSLGNENRWSDLLAVLVEADPAVASAVLGLRPALERPHVRRERRGSGKDRIDLVVEDDGAVRALIEVKVLSGLGRKQLGRARTAHPGADAYCVVFPGKLPLPVSAESGWSSVTWDELLSAFSLSRDLWVAETAAAWTAHLKASLPDVGPDTRWNGLQDEEDFVIALRARMSWVYGALEPPAPITHDLVASTAGVNWVTRMNLPARKQGYVIRVEAEETVPVQDFPKYASASRRPRGPSVKVFLVQSGVNTSADFDWDYLLALWQVMGPTRDDWVTKSANPRADHDRRAWKQMVEAGAPKYLGTGFGDKHARQRGECMFGVRFQLPPDVTLQRVVDELMGTADLMLELATT